jgi:hypothetical protein
MVRVVCWPRVLSLFQRSGYKLLQLLNRLPAKRPSVKGSLCFPQVAARPVAGFRARLRASSQPLDRFDCSR